MSIKWRNFFTKKQLTNHIEREHENESNSSVLEKPKIENNKMNNKNRTLLVGPSFSRKTYLLLKNISRTPDQDIYRVTKSPLE